ncbi:MAG: histidine phosphatase family protein [Roseiflexaceae bacterium]
MRLYIIRHGDPDYTTDTLTEIGRREAQALAERLANEHLTHIYSSPLGRARETMRYTAEATNLMPSIEEWTRELAWWIPWETPRERIAAWDLHGELIRGQEHYPSHNDWHTLKYFENPDFRTAYNRLGEQSDDLMRRHGYARENGRYRCVRPNHDRVAVFCHGGFGLTWLAHLLALPLVLAWSGFWLPPSSVTTVLFDERSPEWAVPRCIGLGDVSHLYAAGLPVQARGIIANFE